VSTTLTPALGRALGLLADPPAILDVGNGDLDLLGGGLPSGTPAVGAMFSSRVRAMVYDDMLELTRRVFSGFRQPTR
jgi:arsenite methyltransferase